MQVLPATLLITLEVFKLVPKDIFGPVLGPLSGPASGRLVDTLHPLRPKIWLRFLHPWELLVEAHARDTIFAELKSAPHLLRRRAEVLLPFSQI